MALRTPTPEMNAWVAELRALLGLKEQAAAGTAGSTGTADAPAGPTPTAAQGKALTGHLLRLARQIPGTAAGPGHRAALLKIAAEARDAIGAGDLRTAAAGIAALRQALRDGPGAGAEGQAGAGTDADAMMQAVDRARAAETGPGAPGNFQVAQMVLPGVPLPLPVPPDAVPAPIVPRSVEKAIGTAVGRAGRRMARTLREAADGDLSGAAGHAFLGRSFPAEVDDPDPAFEGRAQGTQAGTGAPAGGRRRVAGQPEAFPAGGGPPPVREGLDPPPPVAAGSTAHPPPPRAASSSTAHPMPAPVTPQVVTASNLADMDLPRTPGLGAEAPMKDLVAGNAVPGREGVVLTDPPDDPAELYPDMHKLFEANGVEYALVRRSDGKLVLSSGAANKVRTSYQDQPLSHTHPSSEPRPSDQDARGLNELWRRNLGGPRPSSTIVWGSNPGETTPYWAEGTDDTIPSRKRRGSRR